MKIYVSSKLELHISSFLKKIIVDKSPSLLGPLNKVAKSDLNLICGMICCSHRAYFDLQISKSGDSKACIYLHIQSYNI